RPVSTPGTGHSTAFPIRSHRVYDPADHHPRAVLFFEGDTMSVQFSRPGGTTAALGASLLFTGALAAQGPGTDWPSYNRTLTSERFAPLDQINRTNVSRLKQLCVFDFNVDTSFQTGPIVIGRVLYATTDKEILAMDAETCQQK